MLAVAIDSRPQFPFFSLSRHTAQNRLRSLSVRMTMVTISPARGTLFQSNGKRDGEIICRHDQETCLPKHAVRAFGEKGAEQAIDTEERDGLLSPDAFLTHSGCEIASPAVTRHTHSGARPGNDHD